VKKKEIGPDAIKRTRMKGAKIQQSGIDLERKSSSQTVAP